MRKSTMPSPQEWWEALRWVLVLATFIIILTLAGSFVSYEGVISQGHPWLPRTVCPGCPFCGMTRSFCALSSGRWQEAVTWNRGGPVLYTLGWFWILGAVVFGSRLFRIPALKLMNRT